MSGISFRGLTLTLLVAFLVWSSSIETCNARRGQHWRKYRSFSASLTKKKPKTQSSKSKPKTQPPPPPQPKENNPSSTFNVLDFGAKGDGTTDDTKAFEAAWAAACQVEASKIIVPSEYNFLVGPISFSGPHCQKNIVFQLDGTITAPTNPKIWGSGLLQWLEFTKLQGISVQGKGIINGKGSLWWTDSPYNNYTISTSLSGKMLSTKPTALRFYGSSSVTVTGITIQNSPQCHLKFDSCTGVSVFSMSVSSPGDSPNTDGIHLQNSNNVLIHNTDLACGDDCISIQTGCSNVHIRNVNCGPGHGISIGGLGNDDTKACVSNITVRDTLMKNTLNGVRIKTWQGGLGSVQGITFSNIQVSEVQNPIVINQFYCDKSKCKNQTSAVAVSEITYEKIKGTYTGQPVYLACSDSLPCTGVTLTDIELKPVQEHGYNLYDPFCWQTYGQLTPPTIPSINCVQSGTPLNNSNSIQTYESTC